MSDVIRILRDAEAVRAARLRYARAHDKFAELEQRHALTNPIEAAGAHEYALIALRAYRAELDDPAPRDSRTFDHDNREGQWR